MATTWAQAEIGNIFRDALRRQGKQHGGAASPQVGMGYSICDDKLGREGETCLTPHCVPRYRCASASGEEEELLMACCPHAPRRHATLLSRLRPVPSPRCACAPRMH